MNVFAEEIHEAKESVASELIPVKSGKIYSACYEKFIDWSTKKNISEYTENVLLAYFYDESKKVKCSTMWSHYSMLKLMLVANNNIDISKFRNLVAFLKKKHDEYRPKKSKFFTGQELEAFFSHAPDDRFLFMKVVAIIAIAGACRREDLVKMTIDDIQDTGSSIIVNVPATKIYIQHNFLDNEQVSYLQTIRKYMDLRPICDHRRFFVNYIGGKCTKQPVGINKIGRIPSKIAAYLNLIDARDYTSHAFRRTAATLFRNRASNIANLNCQGGWKLTSAKGCVGNSIQTKVQLANEVLGGGGDMAATSEVSAYTTIGERKEEDVEITGSEMSKPQTFSVMKSKVETEIKEEPFHKELPSVEMKLEVDPLCNLRLDDEDCASSTGETNDIQQTGISRLYTETHDNCRTDGTVLERNGRGGTPACERTGALYAGALQETELTTPLPELNNTHAALFHENIPLHYTFVPGFETEESRHLNNSQLQRLLLLEQLKLTRLQTAFYQNNMETHHSANIFCNRNCTKL